MGTGASKVWDAFRFLEREDGTKVDNPSVPDTFEECLFGAACLGYPNTRLAGKYYNLTSGDSLNEESEDLALSDYGEQCNFEWGHSHICII